MMISMEVTKVTSLEVKKVAEVHGYMKMNVDPMERINLFHIAQKNKTPM